MAVAPVAAAAAGLGLGLDAGGTHTRWALARRGDVDGAAVVIDEGVLPPMSGQQLADAEGRQQLAATLAAWAQAVAAATERWGTPPSAVVAGITGFDAQAMPQWRTLAAQALGLQAQQVHACSDIELACAAAFAPGQGVVLVAGTGSIAAHVDAQGQLHRAGGRGAVIDDAGSGHWIARQALQHIWRAEDTAPGSWNNSTLARCVFDAIGGPDWAQTRQWVYGATRGELGTLALAVARAAGGPQGVMSVKGVKGVAPDPVALAILQQAGQELARLVLALQQRLGPQPVALTGRVFELHPAVEAALRQALPAATALQRQQTPAHHAGAQLAAQLAAGRLPPQWQQR